MSGVDHHRLEELIDASSTEVGLLWPLDRAVAANPLLDRLELGFSSAVTQLGARLGVDLWPGPDHLEEAARRGLIAPSAARCLVEAALRRPPTLLERAQGLGPRELEGPRAMVGQVLLESAAGQGEADAPLLERAAGVLRSSAGWVRGPRRVRREAAQLLESGDLGHLVDRLAGWGDDEVIEEMARHFARLPGWAAWAKWNDCWARELHRAAVTRRALLALSLAVDLAWLAQLGSSLPAAPAALEVPREAGEGLARLELIERAVHGELLEILAPRSPQVLPQPRYQIVTCIDVRSEPLRRALERTPEVETFGFAGFFGVFALVAPAGERETYESLPVIGTPSVTITGGQPPSTLADSRVATGGVLAELTHEPTAMFALAEASGLLGSPWLLARSLVASSRSLPERAEGPWQLEAEHAADIAEGALRGMGLTGPFAAEVLFLGHSSSTANNPHFATLECGACAGHAGGPNAAALAGVLNDPGVRRALGARGIDIPAGTRFLSGEHDTTRELIELHDPASPGLSSLLDEATGAVAVWRAGEKASRVGAARRRLDRRARDWAETRPEWGLADHAAFVVAPRSSLRGDGSRGAKLPPLLRSGKRRGRRDPALDPDGSDGGGPVDQRRLLLLDGGARAARCGRQDPPQPRR